MKRPRSPRASPSDDRPETAAGKRKGKGKARVDHTIHVPLPDTAYEYTALPTGEPHVRLMMLGFGLSAPWPLSEGAEDDKNSCNHINQPGPSLFAPSSSQRHFQRSRANTSHSRTRGVRRIQPKASARRRAFCTSPRISTPLSAGSSTLLVRAFASGRTRSASIPIELQRNAAET
jgi:hypothetical protein